MAMQLLQRTRTSTQRKTRLMQAATLPAAAAAAAAATFITHTIMKIQMLILGLVMDLTALLQR
jgi:hypothetical protein